MTCPPDTGILLDYAAGRLNPATADALAQHMKDCERCASVALGQAEVYEALDLWPCPPVSRDFNRRLWARIEAAGFAPWHERLVQSAGLAFFKRAIPLAAAALVITAGFLSDHRSRVAPPPSPRVSAVEADQAERTIDDIQLLRQFNTAVAAAQPAKSM